MVLFSATGLFDDDYRGNVMDSMFNNDSDSNLTFHGNATPQMNYSGSARDVPLETEGSTNIIIGAMIVTINGLLIRAIFSHQRTLNWKRYACILNLSISDFLCGLVLIIRGMADFTQPHSLFESIMGLEVCANILLTIFNYDLQLSVQYLAIKKPLYYQTKLTVTKILVVVCILWTLIGVYTTVKAYVTFNVDWESAGTFFKSVDTAAMGLSLIFNSMFYTHVLTVAAKKRRESLIRSRKLSEKLSTSSIESESCPVIRQSIFYQYNSVITLGIQLVVYIATVTPLFVYWLYGLGFGISGLRVTGVVFESFWFSRAILDPLIFLLRERRFLSVCELPSWCIRNEVFD